MLRCHQSVPASQERRTVMTDALTALSTAGVSIWLDDLSRERLVSGSLAGLAARDHVVGVTTNPAIFAKAITGSDAYRSQICDLSARGVDMGEALRALTTFDVRSTAWNAPARPAATCRRSGRSPRSSCPG